MVRSIPVPQFHKAGRLIFCIVNVVYKVNSNQDPWVLRNGLEPLLSQDLPLFPLPPVAPEQLLPNSLSASSTPAINSDASSVSSHLLSRSSLSRLSSLKHLRLMGRIENINNFMTYRINRHVEGFMVYSAPFMWIQKALEEMVMLPAQRPALALEQLTLDISISVEPETLFGVPIPWSVLTSALSSFRLAMPSLKIVEIRAIQDFEAEAQDFNMDEMGESKVIDLLEADVHLGPLIREGQVRVSSVSRAWAYEHLFRYY